MSVSQQEFTQLHEEYRDRLLNSMTEFTGNRDEAEDITSAALEKAFKRRHTFRGESSLYTWVHAIAFNEVRSKRQARRLVSLDALEGFEPHVLIQQDLLAQTLERTECCRRVRKTVRKIPAVYRQVLVNHFIDGQSVRRIAKQFEVPVGTVLSRMFTAKQLLREAWEA